MKISNATEQKPISFLANVNTSELPLRDRTCTDKLFLILIVVIWIGSVIIGLSALGVIDTYSFTGLTAGNPDLITHAVDYRGNICGNGINSGASRSYRPNLSGKNYDNLGTLVPTFLTICVSRCPQAGDTVEDPYGTYGEWIVQ
jgi:hypothetical protein